MTSKPIQIQQSSVQEWPEWQFLDATTELLATLTTAVRSAPSSNYGLLYPFLDSIEESTGTLRVLAERLMLRDSYVIARVIYETAINACFLLTDPTRLSERASLHAKQKTLRNLVRKIEIAGTPLFEYKQSNADELMQEPEHKKLLDEFTSKSGREITSWTPENVQQRLEAVYLQFGAEATKGLAFGLLMYRHASEIAHGTLYGTLFSWGAVEPNRPLQSPDDLSEFRRAELRHLLKLVCFSLESLIRVAGPVVGATGLADAAKKAFLAYYEAKDA
ncbi:MAG: DUF5677 domain-containing protein [Comamonas sp.]